jgi:hypothetical protein
VSFITAASDIFSPRLQISYLSSAGLLVSSVPAATWKKALANLEDSMSRIKTVCDPDQPLDVSEWGKL